MRPTPLAAGTSKLFHAESAGAELPALRDYGFSVVPAADVPVTVDHAVHEPDPTDPQIEGMSESELSGQTALVTGGTSGIGLATARLLRQAGAHVVISGRDARRGSVAASDIGGGTRFIAADMADLESVDYLAGQAPIDILVNTAAAAPRALSVDHDIECFTRTYDINVRGLYYLVGEVALGIIRHGGGAIVNVTSAPSIKGIPGSSAYSSTKAAVESLTRTWAVEFGSHRIRVNSVAPGWVRSVVGQVGNRSCEKGFDAFEWAPSEEPVARNNVAAVAHRCCNHSARRVPPSSASSEVIKLFCCTATPK